MDLSKLCIDTSSNEDSETSNSFRYSNRYGDTANQNVDAQTLTSNDNHQEQSTLYNRSRLKHVIEQCTFLQKDILRYQSEPFTEEIRSVMLNQVYGTTSEMLNSLKSLQESQQQDTSLPCEQYNSINEYNIIRQARNLNDPEGPKYRRRSKRSMVGQYCHSCKTTETPEWRRGPDGARTLCNACGLHYSKLLRKGSLTVQTHNYLIESPSTYQRMTRRLHFSDPKIPNASYQPSLNGANIIYKTDGQESTK